MNFTAVLVTDQWLPCTPLLWVGKIFHKSKINLTLKKKQRAAYFVLYLRQRIWILNSLVHRGKQRQNVHQPLLNCANLHPCMLLLAHPPWVINETKNIFCVFPNKIHSLFCLFNTLVFKNPCKCKPPPLIDFLPSAFLNTAGEQSEGRWEAFCDHHGHWNQMDFV